MRRYIEEATEHLETVIGRRWKNVPQLEKDGIVEKIRVARREKRAEGCGPAASLAAAPATGRGSGGGSGGGGVSGGSDGSDIAQGARVAAGAGAEMEACAGAGPGGQRGFCRGGGDGHGRSGTKRKPSADATFFRKKALKSWPMISSLISHQ